MHLHLEGLADTIAFDGAEDLVPVLARVLCGWSWTEGARGKGRSRIRLSRGADGYERRSPWIQDGDAMVLADPVDAVCDLLLDIERAYVEDARGRGEALTMILHAAAVEMGTGANQGLVVFPSTHATGKSLLTMALAQAGHRVFADDQLPLLPGTPATGIAPGFLPRVRRPLPEDLDGSLAGFVRAHPGPLSDRFRYVELDEARLAPLGSRAQVSGVVLLERRDGAAVAVRDATEADVLKACVLQSFGRTLRALDVLDHLHAMVLGAKCVHLTYGDAAQAVPALQEVFI